jgi:hypothetical protein
LSDGGYAATPLAEMLPLRLLGEKTFVRNFADASLTEAGRESVITRIVEGRDANIARWKKMPQVANYAVLGEKKPGAVVLMDVAEPNHHRLHVLEAVAALAGDRDAGAGGGVDAASGAVGRYRSSAARGGQG